MIKSVGGVVVLLCGPRLYRTVLPKRSFFDCPSQSGERGLSIFASLEEVVSFLGVLFLPTRRSGAVVAESIPLAGYDVLFLALKPKLSISSNAARFAVTPNRLASASNRVLGCE